MAISEIARTAPPPPSRKGPLCTVCQALADLPKKEAAALERLLADTSWRYKEIAQRIAKDPDYPLNIDHTTYGRHARGECHLMRLAGRRLR